MKTNTSDAASHPSREVSGELPEDITGQHCDDTLVPAQGNIRCGGDIWPELSPGHEQRSIQLGLTRQQRLVDKH